MIIDILAIIAFFVFVGVFTYKTRHRGSIFGCKCRCKKND